MEVERILIMSPNWLGDAVMAMPAVTLFHAKNPSTHITVVAKKSVSTLWKVFSIVDDVIELESGTANTFRVAFKIRQKKWDKVYIMPNSFRSALIPFIGGVKSRRGTAFHGRRYLINDKVDYATLGNAHQSFEYAYLMTGEIDEVLPDINLDTGKSKILAKSGISVVESDTVIGIIPGAARGESKRWPHFTQAALLIREKIPTCKFVVMGTAKEAELCNSVACGIGANVFNAAGKTNLLEFASMLARCDVVLCNDSGGMHLAVSAGTPVVAVYGLTDYKKTGPLKSNSKILYPKDVSGQRDISRNDSAASEALSSIKPEDAFNAAMEILKEKQ